MNTPLLRAAPALVLAALLAACASSAEKGDPDFFTSGSRDADQRAEQRISRDQQLRGESVEAASGKSKDDAKRTLYERLGGEPGVRAIVSDFIDRALVDPRVNWNRVGIKRGGVLGIGGKSAEWTPDAASVARIKDHVAQFISVASGGPARYEGRDMKTVHGGMKITNAEFDASVGDLKAAMDALRVGLAEQKELLAVVESTRPQIAEER